MRNLKRALSMALAAIMVLGLMVVGASATSYEDFTDKDEIKNKEAVNTMVSLGVISGKDNGSYDPNGSLTRAEACTLIARMLGGGKDPVLGSNIKSNFTDTKGHWAETYIAYCANLGIIVGVGDGSFNPDGTLTGTAAAKMVLCALGYKPEFEGIGGANWELATNTLATKVKLYDGLESLNPSETISRDDVAQLLYNGVQAQEVEYRNLQGDYQGTLYATEKGTMLHNRFLVDKVEGVVVSTNLISMSGWTTTVEGKTRLDNISVNGTRYQDNAGKDLQAIYPVAIDSDLLGQRVVLYVQGLKDLAPNAASTKVISEPIISADNTVVETTSRLKDADAVKDALKGSGVAIPTGGAAGVTITEDTTAKAANGYTGIQSMPGVTQSFIDNNADGYVDVIIAKNPALAKINTYNESKENMNISGIGTEDFVDILNPKDVAQGDYVLVYNYDDTYVLEKAETVSGVVTAYVNNKDNVDLSKITIDGTNYGKGSGKNLAPDVTTVNTSVLKDLVDGTYTLYLDPNGNILGYVEDAAAIGSYAVITGVNATGNVNFRSVEVKLLMADGTTGKYDVNLLASAKKWDKDNTGVNTGSNSNKEEAMFAALRDNGLNTLVTYSLDNNTVTLGRPASTNNYGSDTTAASLKLNNSTSSYTFTSNKLMADDNTAFFIRDTKGNYSVTKGLKNLPSDPLNTTGTVSAIYYLPTGSKTPIARAIFAQVDREFVSNSNYAFITSDYTKTTSGSDTIYTYTVVNENGETLELKSKSEDWVDKTWVQQYQMDGEYVIFSNDNNMINEQVVLDTGVNAVSVASEKDGVTGKTSYPVPASAKIWNVEDTDNIFATTLQKYDKVALVLDEDNNVKTAYVYDRQDGDLAAASTLSLKIGGTSYADGAVINTVTNDELKLTVALANDNQTVTVAVKATNAGANATVGASSTKIDKNNVGNAAVNPVLIYKADGTENGTKLTITVSTAQDGYATRTNTYNVTLYSFDDTTYLADAKTSDITNAATTKVVVTGDLTVDSALDLNNKNVTVKGNVALDYEVKGLGTLTVEGTTTVKDGVTINADVDTASLVFSGVATIENAKTVDVTGTDKVVLKGTTTVDGNLNIAGTLELNGQTLQGSGTVTVNGTVVLGSTITGAVTVKAASAVLKGNFTISGGTLEIAGNITDETAGASKITVSGTAALTVKGDTAANVTATGTATVTVEGEATGTVTNEGTGTVTVGNEAIAKPVEVTEAEVKVGTLHDTRVDGSQIPDEDLVGTYTVTGTKTTVGDSTKTNTYTLTLTATDLKEHQNAGTPESMGYWAGIMVKADKTDEYMFGWGTYPGTFNKAGDLSSESPESQDGFVGFYRNFGADNASNSFYIAVKDTSGNIDIYNVACNVTKG